MRAASRSTGPSCPLTYSEFEVLDALLRAGGRLLSRQELLDAIFGGHEFRDPRAIDVHVHFLRDKLAAAGGRPGPHRHRPRRGVPPEGLPSAGQARAAGAVRDRPGGHQRGDAVRPLPSAAARAPPGHDRLRDMRELARTAAWAWRGCRAATCAAARSARPPSYASWRGAWAAAWPSSTRGRRAGRHRSRAPGAASATPSGSSTPACARGRRARPGDQGRGGRRRAGPHPRRAPHARAAQVAERHARRRRGRPRRAPGGRRLGILIAAGLGIALGYGLLRRLERLRRDARRLAEEGIEQPLAIRAGRDEMGEVALALETMRSRLHAEERGRQAFLATASHELRTPLASLRGTVELLEEELAAAPDLGGPPARRRSSSPDRPDDGPRRGPPRPRAARRRRAAGERAGRAAASLPERWRPRSRRRRTPPTSQ